MQCNAVHQRGSKNDAQVDRVSQDYRNRAARAGELLEYETSDRADSVGGAVACRTAQLQGQKGP